VSSASEPTRQSAWETSWWAVEGLGATTHQSPARLAASEPVRESSSATRLVGPESELIDGEPVEVGLRFGRGHILAAGHNAKPAQQSEPAQVFLTMGVSGVGGECDGPPAVARRVHQGNDPGQHGLGEDADAFVELQLSLEVAPVLVWTERPPWVEGVLGVTDAPQEEIAVKGPFMGRVHVGESVDQRRLRVENESVKIKNEGAEHGIQTRGSRCEPATQPENGSICKSRIAGPVMGSAPAPRAPLGGKQRATFHATPRRRPPSIPIP
jgi:hypothetical protein